MQGDKFEAFWAWFLPVVMYHWLNKYTVPFTVTVLPCGCRRRNDPELLEEHNPYVRFASSRLRVRRKPHSKKFSCGNCRKPIVLPHQLHEKLGRKSARLQKVR